MRRLLRAHHYQDPNAWVRQLAAKHEPQIADAIDTELADFAGDQDDEALTDAYAAGGIAGLIAAMAFSELRQGMQQSVQLDGLFRDAAAEGGLEAGLTPASTSTVSIPVELPQAANTGVFYADLDLYRKDLIDGIVTSAEDGVAAAAQRAAQLGLPVQEIAAAVKDAIGLSERQAFAVFNYRRALEEGAASAGNDDAWKLRDRRYDGVGRRAALGEPVDQGQIDRAVAAYARRSIRYRAQMIAQGEAMKVANAGARANYTQAINNGTLTQAQITRHWLVDLDEKTCAICLSIPILNPNGVGMFTPFLSIEGPVMDVGLHPWCRCSVEYRVAMVAARPGVLVG